MNEEQCPNPAVYQYPWAGQIIRGCKQHANIMAVLAGAIGSPMQIEELSEEGICEHPNDLKDPHE